ncbi:MAG: type II toxin-antitoxin system HicB family antitoxin, partial [Candidatus Portnoybacteria bacterium CG06_land_8_20_14_3_00_39_12]
MPKINLKNVVWKEGEYYVAQCLNVDVSSFGKTKKEALANLDEALDLYFEDST